MNDIERVSPATARGKVRSGSALLVCAYDSDEKYWRMRLEGSIALSTFRSVISGIPKDREIIFF